MTGRQDSRFRKDPDPRFWRFNRSIEFDWRLAPYDIDQSKAHARGLCGIGVLTEDELAQIENGLDRVRARMAEHGFEFEPADEDIHMAIERLLGEEIGPLAGKLHTGRSRNDQVATDVAMVVQAHSLALPFFPSMSEAQVDRVCQQLAAALGQGAIRE